MKCGTEQACSSVCVVLVHSNAALVLGNSLVLELGNNVVLVLGSIQVPELELGSKLVLVPEQGSKLVLVPEQGSKLALVLGKQVGKRELACSNARVVLACRQVLVHSTWVHSD
ncbi:MAG: hypothetical protein AAFN77_23765 [Planctomycetota bacterium]